MAIDNDNSVQLHFPVPSSWIEITIDPELVANLSHEPGNSAVSPGALRVAAHWPFVQRPGRD